MKARRKLTIPPSAPARAPDAKNIIAIWNDTSATQLVEAGTRGHGRVYVEIYEGEPRLYVSLAGDFGDSCEVSTGWRRGNLRAVNFETENPDDLRQFGEALIAAAMRAESCGLFAQLKANQQIAADAARRTAAAGLTGSAD